MVLDLGVVAMTAYYGMVANGVRTAEGVLLEELPSLEAVLQSFPMQKFCGDALFTYNVYGCFLVPFLAEAAGTILLPYHIGVILVRSKPIPFRRAIDLLGPTPMDLGRYADLVMNASLTCAAFFTASGFVLPTLVGLLG